MGKTEQFIQGWFDRTAVGAFAIFHTLLGPLVMMDVVHLSEKWILGELLTCTGVVCCILMGKRT